jgi:hypothetical protein
LAISRAPVIPDDRNDVVALRERIGGWAAGTVGTAVSIYDDAALVEVADDVTGEGPDMFVVPADVLEIRPRYRTPPTSDMEAWWKPVPPRWHRQTIYSFKVNRAVIGNRLFLERSAPTRPASTQDLVTAWIRWPLPNREVCQREGRWLRECSPRIAAAAASLPAG